LIHETIKTKIMKRKDRLSELLSNYVGEFNDLFTEIGKYRFGSELGIAKVFYSKKYQIFKVRNWYDTYFKNDYGIEVKNSKDQFYDKNCKKIGSSLTGALLDKYVRNFIVKYNIKSDQFSKVKMLFVSMITDKGNNAKTKLKAMKSNLQS
jgi:hypothetical protein